MRRALMSFLFCFLLTLSTNAQGIIQGNTETNLEEGNLANAGPINFNLIEQPQSNLSVEADGAFINQIGSNNAVNLSTSGNSTGIVLDQLGNGNQINLNLRADRIDYGVLQNGNNNYLLEFNTNATNQLLQRQVEQIGNNQNLVIHGQNRIVDRMRITMQGSQSIIIRNSF